MGHDKRLAHIVLQTGQRTALRDWYLMVLDAHIVFENQMLSFLTFDDEHHRLAIAQLPVPTPRTSTTVGMAHSAYTFADDATACMQGPDYAANPFGPSFEPDVMLAAQRGGAAAVVTAVSGS
jgi:catechol-2,3-dioxygenase